MYKINIENLKIKTADFFKIDIADFESNRRLSKLIKARSFLMRYIKDNSKFSLLEIGTYFNDKDHSSVLHALSKLSDSFDVYPQEVILYKDYVSFIETEKQIFANTNDISLLITEFENNLYTKKETYKDFQNIYFDLLEIFEAKGMGIGKNTIFKNIRELLLEKKVSEYTLNENRLYSFIEVGEITRLDKRCNRMIKYLTKREIEVLGFVILQAKHIASINKIKNDIDNSSIELILDKYIDCLNYYILYETYVRAVNE
jgi:hypothetical protein